MKKFRPAWLGSAAWVSGVEWGWGWAVTKQGRRRGWDGGGTCGVERGGPDGVEVGLVSVGSKQCAVCLFCHGFGVLV